MLSDSYGDCAVGDLDGDFPSGRKPYVDHEEYDDGEDSDLEDDDDATADEDGTKTVVPTSSSPLQTDEEGPAEVSQIST